MPSHKIFLSHRFADKPIADVVRRHLENWGFEGNCYQASAPGVGPMAGEFITNELREALYQAQLVILIFTLNDYDWSFCMWECGLATHPKKVDTRTVVLQCNPHDAPRIYEGHQLVDCNKDGLLSFVTQFFRDDGFFPGEPAIRPAITDGTITDYTESLYEDLMKVVPPGRREERYRWDFLTLQLTRADILEVINQAKKNIASGAYATLQERCLLIDDFGEALKHFGYATRESNLSLAALIDRWKTAVKDRENCLDTWINELNNELFRAIDNAPANPSWLSMNSATHKSSWLYPVVNHVRVLPDGSMEFDIYFYLTQDQTKSK